MGTPLRVAVVSTGNIGSLSIRSVLRRPDLELVGVWVHSDDKAGRDAGEVVGLPPVGLRTTQSLDDIVAARPDCVVYAATGPDLDATSVPHYDLMLRAGIDVVTTATPGLVFPDGWDPVRRAALEDACTAGGSTIYASGIEPGFVGDQLAVLLATQSESIETLRTQEIFSYAGYANEFLMRDVFGFGMPMDVTPLMEYGGSQLLAWGPPVLYVAAALGVEVDETARPTATRDRPRPRGGLRHDRCRHLRGDPDGDHRRGRRPGRDRHRAREPDGRGPRPGLAHLRA